ncbi:hypothetical protein EVAR_72008_1 [Eumeta japonica]|uniref:Reverse transcriptase domain-containing protein n=1 Tax=Eumeta variegata TaxID=151549 RepID=A0A4C1SZP9_EUMVA|nr:hypothetical protein EVAR_72008_1 [Eumeta japonica]
MDELSVKYLQYADDHKILMSSAYELLAMVIKMKDYIKKRDIKVNVSNTRHEIQLVDSKYNARNSAAANCLRMMRCAGSSDRWRTLSDKVPSESLKNNLSSYRQERRARYCNEREFLADGRLRCGRSCRRARLARRCCVYAQNVKPSTVNPCGGHFLLCDGAVPATVRRFCMHMCCSLSRALLYGCRVVPQSRRGRSE